MSLIRKIPTNVAPPMPAAKYSHSVEVSRGHAARTDVAVCFRADTAPLSVRGRGDCREELTL
jgi:hypothetical protein